jgi:hypothetical protein
LFVNDMVMWPTAFLSDHFQWEPIDARSARARVNLHGRQFSAVLHFNDIGEWSTLSPRIDISWSAKGTSEPSGQHHCGVIVRQTGCVILPKVTPSGICREVSSHIYKPQLARLATARSTSTNSHHAILQEQSEEVPMDFLTIVASMVLVMHGLTHWMGSGIREHMDSLFTVRCGLWLPLDSPLLL